MATIPFPAMSVRLPRRAPRPAKDPEGLRGCERFPRRPARKGQGSLPGLIAAVLVLALLGPGAGALSAQNAEGPDGGRTTAGRDGGRPVAEGAAVETGQGRFPPEVQVCLGCHTLDRDQRRGADAAPPLWGILGRSPQPEGVGVPSWTRESLGRWLRNPRAMAPRTESRFPGYADPERREAVLRFLEGQG